MATVTASTLQTPKTAEAVQQLESPAQFTNLTLFKLLQQGPLGTIAQPESGRELTPKELKAWETNLRGVLSILEKSGKAATIDDLREKALTDEDSPRKLGDQEANEFGSYEDLSDEVFPDAKLIAQGEEVTFDQIFQNPQILLDEQNWHTALPEIIQTGLRKTVKMASEFQNKFKMPFVDEYNQLIENLNGFLAELSGITVMANASMKAWSSITPLPGDDKKLPLTKHVQTFSYDFLIWRAVYQFLLKAKDQTPSPFEHLQNNVSKARAALQKNIDEASSVDSQEGFQNEKRKELLARATAQLARINSLWEGIQEQANATVLALGDNLSNSLTGEALSGLKNWTPDFAKGLMGASGTPSVPLMIFRA